MKERRETLLYVTGGVVLGGIAGFVSPEILRWFFSDSTIPGASELLETISRDFKIGTTALGCLAGAGLSKIVHECKIAEKERQDLDKNLEAAVILAKQQRGSARIATALTVGLLTASVGAGVLAEPTVDMVSNIVPAIFESISHAPIISPR